MRAIKTTTVSIPKSLAEKIKKKLKKAGSDSIDSYVTYVLEKSLVNMEEKVFSAGEERKVKERLKSLGYLE